MKKNIRIIGILLFAGFSFFYTEKVTKIIKKKDPIMIKLNEVKNDSYISAIKPIIENDEYTTGINGCEIDINKSYDKMKTIKEYNEDLIVMKEVINNNNLNDKYIVGANKIQKKVSLIFIIKDEISDNLVNFLLSKKINGNFFVNLDYLEDNTQIIKLISNNNNFYFLVNNKYDDNYILYANNLIEMNSNNSSNYCFTDKKDDKLLKLCSKNNMKTIKTDIITDNILSNIENKLSNGSIIAIESNDIEKIKISINYILSKGYDIVRLEDLLNESNNCNK
ncbi:MAG: hypothetical protein IJ105_00015 [Bacilli bacterium]|nr:hypothetical protein [Bacilli bacterium]